MAQTVLLCSEKSEFDTQLEIRVLDKVDKFHSRTFPGYYDLFELTQANPERYPFLLETTAKSTQKNFPTARYDILFAFPQSKLIKHSSGKLFFDSKDIKSQSFLTALDQCWRNNRMTSMPDLKLPFTGGWFIYASYELASEIEPVLNIPDSADGLPVAMAARIPVTIIFDHFENRTTVIAEPGFKEQLEQVEHDLKQELSNITKPSQANTVKIKQEDPQHYRDSLARIHNYIREGDVFQVNLSRLWKSELADATPASIYRRLRKSNPAPFAGYAQLGQSVILSSSPERLVAVKNGRIETRPLAGTRPRGANELIDEALQKELISHPKERAEHVMLIDLERNDLGRLCIPGTVTVDECMVIESYAHVHHIVSNVSGQLCADITPGQIIRAVFPGGTITGCPKVRCMEIIAELEQAARGPYTGSMGYLGHNGNMDLNILIRSILVNDNQISFRAGAGLVADSDAEKELNETRAKAKGMLMAINGEAPHV